MKRLALTLAPFLVLGLLLFQGCSSDSSSDNGVTGSSSSTIPSDHNQNLGGTKHQAGYGNPTANCTSCHGRELKGGDAVSCYACHGALWE